MAAPLAELRAVVALLELEQREAELLDRLERPYPQQLLLQGGMNRSATLLPSGSRTRAGLDVMPRNFGSS